jgi:hypothetical protein
MTRIHASLHRLAFVLLVLALPGCPATCDDATRVRWTTAAVDTGKECLIGKVADAAADAIIDLTTKPTEGMDMSAYAVSLATRHGFDALKCAAAKVWAALGLPALARRAALSPPAKMAKYILDHEPDLRAAARSMTPDPPGAGPVEP